jgi:hypothetical protein
MPKAKALVAICACLAGLGAFGASLQAGVSLDMSLVAPSNLQAFFLEDLNVSGRSPAAEVFRFTITSTSSVELRCYLVFSMSNPQTLIISGQTDPFDLMPNAMLLLSNLNLTEPGSPYELDDYQVSGQAQQIEDQLVQTGYFPADNYRLKLELFPVGSTTAVASDEVVAIITNPFDLRLVSPVGTPSSPAVLLSTTPVFSWSSQATQFLMRICERTSPDMDPQSVMQGRPLYETDSSAPLAGQSFAYPTSGVIPLEPGRVYYWQVQALIQTSSGLQEYPSEIGAFSIAQIAAPQDQRIAFALQRVLGIGHQGIMSQLTGLLPNGRILLDGMEISIEQLEEMALRFEQGSYRIRTVRIE